MKKIIYIIIVIVPFTFLFSFNQTKEKEKNTKPSVKKTEALVLKLKQKEIRENISAFGLIENDHQISLSLPTSGEVKLLDVEPGQFVNKGSLLLSLDKTLQSSNTTQLLGEKEKISYQINNLYLEQENHRKNIERINQLYEDGVATSEEKEKAQLQLDLVTNQISIQEESLKTLRSKIDLADFNTSQYSLRAPQNGIVEKVLIKKHEQLRAGQEVLIFSPLGKNATVNLKLTAREVSKIQKGQEARVYVDFPSKKEYSAKVKSIGYAKGRNQSHYNVMVSFDASKDQLIYGSLVKVEILTNAVAKGYYIPLDAIENVDENSIDLLTLQLDSTLRKMQFDYQGIDKQFVLINNSSQESLEIVVDKSIGLGEGEKVQVITYKEG